MVVTKKHKAVVRFIIGFALAIVGASMWIGPWFGCLVAGIAYMALMLVRLHKVME